MKRFYKVVSTRAEREGFSILLDGKLVRTPGGNALAAPTEALAGAVMKEWADQKEKINPQDMPLTQILNTRIDRAGAQRAAITQAVLGYLDTDLLCYRAPRPPELLKSQEESWGPWLEWFAKQSGANLLTTSELVALRQPAKAHGAAQAFVGNLDDDHFTVLQMTASLSGSLVLAMAFAARAIGPEEVFACARVEERYKALLYNEEKHGPDPAQEQKDRVVLQDLKAAAAFLEMLAGA